MPLVKTVQSKSIRNPPKKRIIQSPLPNFIHPLFRTFTLFFHSWWVSHTCDTLRNSLAPCHIQNIWCVCTSSTFFFFLLLLFSSSLSSSSSYFFFALFFWTHQTSLFRVMSTHHTFLAVLLSFGVHERANFCFCSEQKKFHFCLIVKREGECTEDKKTGERLRRKQNIIIKMIFNVFKFVESGWLLFVEF